MDSNYEKPLPCLKPALLYFSKCKVSKILKLQNTLKLRPKMAYLGILMMEFEKSTVIFYTNTLEFFKMQSFV